MTSISHLDAHGTFGPDALDILRIAFDAAWAEIRVNSGDDPVHVQSARNELANALLTAAGQVGCDDAERLRTAALRTMALNFVRRRPF